MSTATEKLEAIERELTFRRRVYPRLVNKGSMTQRKSDSEISILMEVADDYRRLAEGERLL